MRGQRPAAQYIVCCTPAGGNDPLGLRKKKRRAAAAAAATAGRKTRHAITNKPRTHEAGAAQDVALRHRFITRSVADNATCEHIPSLEGGQLDSSVGHGRNTQTHCRHRLLQHVLEGNATKRAKQQQLRTFRLTDVCRTSSGGERLNGFLTGPVRAGIKLGFERHREPAAFQCKMSTAIGRAA